MAVIDHIDGENRRIYLHSDTVGAGLTSYELFYRDYRDLRENNATLQRYLPFLQSIGREPKGGGKYTPRYIKLLNGTRIVPYDTTHDLSVTFEIITDDGSSGINCFDRTPLTDTSNVNIDYAPQQVEIIVVTTGGSALTTEEHNRLFAIPTTALTESRATELLFERENTVVDGQITEYVAGGDITVGVTYDGDGVPLVEAVQ